MLETLHGISTPERDSHQNELATFLLHERRVLMTDSRIGMALVGINWSQRSSSKDCKRAEIRAYELSASKLCLSFVLITRPAWTRGVVMNG